MATLAFGYPVSVQGQATTGARRDSTRVTTREGRGEVALPRDSAAEVERIMRIKAMRARNPLAGTGWYFGIAGGGAAPMGDVSDIGYESGLNLTVPFGFQRLSDLLGVRLDFSYSQFNGGTVTPVSGIGRSNPDAKIYSAALSGTLRVPVTPSRSTALYVLGGGGLYNFRNFGPASALSGYFGNDVGNPFTKSNKDAFTKFGYNVGAGLELGIGTSALMIESRLVSVSSDRGANASFDRAFGSRGTDVRWVPLTVGIIVR
jgi:hypothetical protein